MIHIPVMVSEVMEYLDVNEGGVCIDGTAGAGGHLKEIVKRVGEKGIVIAIDQNKSAIEHLEKQQATSNKLQVVRGNYKFIEKVAESLGVLGSVDGVLLDLGFSSDEIHEQGRGFSFDDNQSLDMRYGQGEEGEYLESCITAEEVVNTHSEKVLADVFWKYGDETRSRFFAKKIIEYRRKKHIETAAELSYVIGNARPTPDGYRAVSERTHALRASPGGFRRDIGFPQGKIHPATKAFMALRIAVNEEFENIQLGLVGTINALRSGGRCVVLTFHSGEDRIVKKFIVEQTRKGTVINLTKHVVKPSRTEVLSNRLSRSAKLRAFTKL